MKKCSSCGQEMTCAADHGGEDPANDRCIRCCHPDGGHKSYDEVLKGMAAFVLSDAFTESGLPKASSDEEAVSWARTIMGRHPAWSKRESLLDL